MCVHNAGTRECGNEGMDVTLAPTLVMFMVVVMVVVVVVDGSGCDGGGGGDVLVGCDASPSSSHVQR